MRRAALCFLLIVSVPTLHANGFNLPSHEVERFVIASDEAGFSYEVLLSGVPRAPDDADPRPLLVVLDGYLLGMTAIETARLMGAVGEIESIAIAAVSPEGGFAVGNLRRLRDFSADPGRDISEEPSFQFIKPGIDASGQTVEEAIGGSAEFRRFLANELIPAVAERTSIDQTRMGILGHSAGGSFLLESLLQGDLPFRDYIVGEAGVFLMFGTEEKLLKEAKPGTAKRMYYADSSDTEHAAPELVADALRITRATGEVLALETYVHRSPGETHTTMIPAFIKDGLLTMYGTNKTYGDRMTEMTE